MSNTIRRNNKSEAPTRHVQMHLYMYMISTLIHNSPIKLTAIVYFSSRRYVQNK
jgi:hypothetical protein